MQANVTKRSLGYREIAKLRATMITLEKDARQALQDLTGCEHVLEVKQIENKFRRLLRAIGIQSRRGVRHLNLIGDHMDRKTKESLR